LGSRRATAVTLAMVAALAATTFGVITPIATTRGAT